MTEMPYAMVLHIRICEKERQQQQPVDLKEAEGTVST